MKYKWGQVLNRALIGNFKGLSISNRQLYISFYAYIRFYYQSIQALLYYKKIVAFLISAACLTACNSDLEKQADKEATTPDAVQQPAELEAGADEISYNKQLNQGGMFFDVTTTGSGSQRSLAIVVEREEQPPVRIDEVIEGIVTSSMVTDLNSNKKPELLVFVSGSGSGSYGKVYGYEFERKYWGEITMPDLTPELQKDYMGHDEFRVLNNRLVRTFPIYLETDPNCCPTGGKRTIVYTLTDALRLAVERVE